MPYVARMLDDLKNLFSRTWETFRTEAGRRDPEDQVVELLSAMRREMVEARASLSLYEEAHRRAATELERERKALVDCERRGAMAERIGDAETVRIAAEFAARHRSRVSVLEEKGRAAKAEWDLRTREAEEMTRQYKEADANRFGLLAQMRATQARGTIRSALGDEPRDAFARAAERVDADVAYSEILEEGVPPRPPRPDVEEQLRELKRRLGQQ